MRACARVALVLMAVSASFGLAGCGSIDDLKDAVFRWFDIGKTPGGRGAFAEDLPDVAPMIPAKKPSRKEASKASKKKDKRASKVQRPQTAEKKLPTSDTTEAPKPQGVEPQSVPSQPTPRDCALSGPKHRQPVLFHAKISHRITGLSVPPRLQVGLAQRAHTERRTATRRRARPRMAAFAKG
jgi:hypothetical protein